MQDMILGPGRIIQQIRLRSEINRTVRSLTTIDSTGRTGQTNSILAVKNTGDLTIVGMSDLRRSDTGRKMVRHGRSTL